MKKRILFAILFFCSFAASAQLNNSWIDYTKTYYKFKLAKDNIYRIPQSVLASAGLSATFADHFQLWRNGQQVRLFTPVSGVPLGLNDYIEFYGEMNDGKPDKTLYRQPSFQLADRYSLETDTASYFLTVNPASVNFRYINTPNVAPAPSAIPDVYFLRKIDLYYRNQISKGNAVNQAGTYIYSSSYDNGEGLVSATTAADVPPTVSPLGVPAFFTETINGLNVFTAGPQTALSVRAKVFYTSANNYRTFSMSLNNTTIPSIAPGTILPSSFPITTNGLSALNVIASNKEISLLGANSVTIKLAHTALFTPGNVNTKDNMVVANIGITYPALFNFNNEKSFYFELAASASGNYLVIENFNYGSIAPILYDINTGRRYLGDISTTPGKVKFVLPASSDIIRKFILNNIETANINTVGSLTTKNFVDLNTASTRGDYIIVSHPNLYNDGTGINNVELYRAYRSSINGGGYNAKIVNIDELTDQFGFGIKSHPTSIRDYVRFIDANYPIKPKALFLIGRGLTYDDKKTLEFTPATFAANSLIADKLDLIPTFGWPPSDILLVSNPTQVNPIIPIGRLGAIDGKEVGYYYQKMLQYEQVQRTQSPLIAEKSWMKNNLQIIGGKDQSESFSFSFYMDQYRDYIKDTLYGGEVDKFLKTSSATIQLESSNKIAQNLADGVGLVKYFGHSSASTFEFNLSDPTVYNNTGKYPIFYTSGCTAGNYYDFNPARLLGLTTLSDKYVLTPQKGSIVFWADTHYGLPNELHTFNRRFFERFCKTEYGDILGSQIKSSINSIAGTNPNLFYNTRIHLEESNLHGDPAIKFNNFPKPDYVIEPQLIKISPSIITVSDPSFKVNVAFRNLGRAINDSIKVSIKRTLSNNIVETMLDTTIFATKYMDSLELIVPINPLKDKGNNKLCVELDYSNKVNELYETNNKACTDFFVFEATLRPIYPYNYAIVNTPSITYSASTANPLLPITSNYVLEVDTTQLFNSPFKKAYNKSGLGGLIEFTPSNIVYTDSMVYYWRTAVIPATGNTIWTNASFVYHANSADVGFNQSHYYQFKNNTYTDMYLDLDRKLKYLPRALTYQVNAAVYPYNGQVADFALINSGVLMQAGFNGPLGTNANSLRFYIIDSLTLAPWQNTTNGSGQGQYGSFNPLPHNQYTILGFYQFDITTIANRQIVKNFINAIPSGNFIAMTNGGLGIDPAYFAPNWVSDPGANMYLALKGLGFNDIDLITNNLAFAFVAKKGTGNAIVQSVGAIPQEPLNITFDVTGLSNSGTIVSDVFGPSTKWKRLKWKGIKQEIANNDVTAVQILGIKNDGTTDLLTTVVNSLDTTIDWINANIYPNLKLKMLNKDSITVTPNQLKYWMVTGDLLPEGAIAPNVLFTMKDTVESGEPINFSLAFKNVSKTAFSDSMKISLKIRNANNIETLVPISKGKRLLIGETLTATYTIPSENYIGANTLIIEFNPNDDQLEQFHFNNILYKTFYVNGDKVNPLLDVTFDGIHILNRDIVSSKPNILIKLKDDNKYLALKDTGLLKIQLKYPGENSYRNIYFNNDTMVFTPANLSNGENAATINLKPYLKKDGDYELVVTGKDVSGNEAGSINYRSTFSVINKPMISEMLNYPNPFTTSTAFVFTLTGSEIPQNIRIQILTISGKIVKEITKAQLGDLHIGNNITDYKWDGRDMYNQPLANGVYLYRVITNLNGNALDKYKGKEDDTEKYFNKGYGKMYLLR